VSVKAYPPDSPGRAQEIPTVNSVGAGGTIATQDEGISVDAAATTLNFVGAGVTATDAGSNVTTVTIPGGSGAPVGAQYVVMALDGTLTDERRLQATTPIVLTDGGANGDATLTHATAGTAGTYGSTSSVPVITTNATGHVTNVTTATVTLGFAAVDLFGWGGDGAFTLDGATTPAWASRSGSIYTMTRSCACTDLTVNNGVTLLGANFNIFANGTLTNNGTIQSNGTAASGASAGNGWGTQFWSGAGSGGAGSGTTAPSAGTATTISIGSAGGAGGSSPSGAGANGGTVTIPTAGTGGLPHALTLLGAWMGRCNGGGPYSGGAGGGGGRGDASGSGGGGGGGGAIIAVFTRYLAGNGTISCNGGNGSAPTAGNVNGGGGGGGGGGVVFIATTTLNPTTVNTITANNGTGGAGKGTGANGTDGTTGRVIVIPVAT
jgi:hypothetical protein